MAADGVILREQLSARGIELGDEAGEGAMAVVYRAVDLRHDRPVAVKVFRPGSGADLGQDRFLREIRVAAQLQHPNILPLYDSGVADGVPYYVMPFVEGQSLRERLARTGQLPLDEALRITREVGDALAFAHARGVVHRDIKPENILLGESHALLADFGVALAVDAKPNADGRLTEVGVVVGSPEYMSPEQASGDQAVDGRSDIFSLGCVLYEMLAGVPPLHGPSLRATLARRFQGPPEPLRERRPEVTEAVSVAVQKALEPDPAARFQRVEDFIAALQEPRRRSLTRRGRIRAAGALAGALALAGVALLANGTTTVATPRLDPHRVAVATLSNETGDRRLDLLGFQVAAWITDRLSRISELEVVTSATTVPAWHHRRVSPDTSDGPEKVEALAGETGAGTLVTGSYYRGDSGTVEFHLEITDANSGDLLRAIGPVYGRGSPDRTADEVSRAVAGAVDSVLRARSGSTGSPAPPAPSPRAARGRSRPASP
jgi:eukaryotic-like serine/threonine-protein kinase